MDTYVILRRNGFKDADTIAAAGVRSTAAGEQMAEDVRWIRTYALNEADGSIGTVCIFEATSPEAIMRHAESAELPVDEVIPVKDTVIVVPDPVTAR